MLFYHTLGLVVPAVPVVHNRNTEELSLMSSPTANSMFCGNNFKPVFALCSKVKTNFNHKLIFPWKGWHKSDWKFRFSQRTEQKRRGHGSSVGKASWIKAPQGGAIEPTDASLIPGFSIGVRKKSWPRHVRECEAKHMYAEISVWIGLGVKKPEQKLELMRQSS